MQRASLSVILALVVTLVMSVWGVASIDGATEVLAPTTDASRLRPEDLETNYYGLIVEWTQKASLDDNISVEICYLDPKVALAAAVAEGAAREDNLDEYAILMNKTYAARTPFRVRFSHGSDVQKLDIGLWDIVVKDDKGTQYRLVDVSGGEPELRTSYSRGTYYQAEYNVGFATSGKQFVTSSTRWISVVLTRNGTSHELKWDFSGGITLTESHTFENLAKGITLAIMVLMSLALIVTRPRIDSRGGTHQCTTN